MGAQPEVADSAKYTDLFDYPRQGICKGCEKPFKQQGRFNRYCSACQVKIEPDKKYGGRVIRRHRTS